MSGDNIIQNRINPYSARIIFFVGFIILGLTSLASLILLSSNSIWVTLLIIVSVYGITWQIDLLVKRREFSRFNAKSVGKVISVHEVVDVETRGFTSTKYYLNSIEVRFAADSREVHLRASLKKTVFDKLQVEDTVPIYYSSKNPRIAVLESELEKSKPSGKYNPRRT